MASRAALLAALLVASASAATPKLSPPGQCTWNALDLPPFQSGSKTCKPPVDETTSGSWAPWSHQPYCIEPDFSIDGPTKYCVFTSSTFRGGLGISLITTPDIAASLAPEIDDAAMLSRLEDARPALGGSNKRYGVKTFLARGKGVVTRRQVEKWERVMVDYPVLVAANDLFNEEVLSEDEAAELREVALKRLPEETQKAVLALSKNKGGEVISDIMRSNMFGLEFDGVAHIGLFIDGARMNHDCKPSAYWRWNNHILGQEVIAIRHIKTGDQVTHSYIPWGLPYEDRRRATSVWGFNCTCNLCSSEKKRRPSDMRRVRLIEIFEELDRATERDTVEGLVTEVDILAPQEDLQPQLAEYYMKASVAFLDSKALDRAREMAEKSEEFWIRYGTEEHDGVSSLRELWAEIRHAEELAAQGPQPRDYYFPPGSAAM